MDQTGRKILLPVLLLAGTGVAAVFLLVEKSVRERPLRRPDERVAELPTFTDPVLGLVRGGKAWALPWWIMKNHYAANLVLDGEAIVIAFCEACSGASAFRADFGGERRRFWLVGTYNGTVLVAEATEGPHEGKGLGFRADELGSRRVGR